MCAYVCVCVCIIYIFYVCVLVCVHAHTCSDCCVSTRSLIAHRQCSCGTRSFLLACRRRAKTAACPCAPCRRQRARASSTCTATLLLLLRSAACWFTSPSSLTSIWHRPCTSLTNPNAGRHGAFSTAPCPKPRADLTARHVHHRYAPFCPCVRVCVRIHAFKRVATLRL
jgi:hypothetical protein